MVLNTYFTKEDKFGLPRSEKLKPDKSVFPKLDLPLEEFTLALAGEYRTFLEKRGYQNQPFQIYLVLRQFNFAPFWHCGCSIDI